jgi:hypothetical protein
MKIRALLAFVAVLFTAPLQAHAAIHLVTQASDLGADDSIDWSQLGDAPSLLFGPQLVSTDLGNQALVLSQGGVFARFDQGTGWAGNFTPGATLLTTAGQGPGITLIFANPVIGAGVQIQSRALGAFTAQVIGIDGAVLEEYINTGTITSVPVFTENGVAQVGTPKHPVDPAIFIGLKSDAADIYAINFQLTAATKNPDAFAISNVAIASGPIASAAPEPGTWLLMLLGVGGVGLVLRRSGYRSGRGIAI